MSVVIDRLSGYQLQLPAFEGPLDVLLKLIERDRLGISEISLLAITTGFIDHVASLVDPEPVLLAQFLNVASRLLLLKSRALLPRREVDEVEGQPDDLVEQLREYQRAKRLSNLLRERAHSGARSHARPLAPQNGTVNVVVVAPPVTHLRRALQRAVARSCAAPEVVQLRLQVTIGEMIERLRVEVGLLRRIRFSGSIRTSTRGEVVAAFIALLALWRSGEVFVQQECQFDDIWVERSSVGQRSS